MWYFNECHDTLTRHTRQTVVYKEVSWHVDLVNGGISTLAFNSSGTHYCLRVQNDRSIVAGLCRASDPFQRLLWRPDYTVRLVSMPDHCVTVEKGDTNSTNFGVHPLRLELCVADSDAGNLFQHFAYDARVGKSDNGNFLIPWGDYVSYLKLVTVKR